MSSVPIYVGRWQDHSRSSSILGDTVTLNVHWGGYLIAALSTFVGLVGTALWLLVAFFIHQYRSSPGQHDGLYFQQQAIYRNQGSASGALQDLFKVCWSWRPRKATDQQLKEKRVNSRVGRSILFSLPPLVVFATFTAAGIFISEVAGPTYETNSVRLASSRCGFFSYDTSTVDGQRAENLKITNDTLAARQYAKTCYQSNTTFSDCALFPVQSLPFSSTMVPCPFGRDPSGQISCIPGSGEAIQMDTGYLDTNRHLGINAAPENRLLFRNVVTCSPIRINDYLEVVNNTDPTFPSVQYNMGGLYTDPSSYTYLYDTHTRADVVAYQITPVYALDGNQAWLPVSALNVSNADISAHFLAQNSVKYLAPVLDPWLSATQLVNDSDASLELILYEPDAFVSVMACTDQYQMCNPTTSPYDCTILGSAKDLRQGYRQIGLNPYQTAIAGRLMPYFVWTSTYQTVLSLSNTALLARDRLVDYIGTGLPPNQWQIEVQGWFATSLASLQSYVIEYAANVADLGPTGFINSPSPDSDDPVTRAAFDQCSNQRVRNVGAYQSFSFLGLMIVICVGSFIILLSWTVEPLVACLRSRRGLRRTMGVGRGVEKHDYREVARVADHTLQLQRKALQGDGFIDGWDAERFMDTIPTTLGSSLFAAPSRYKVDGVDDYHYYYSALPTPGGGQHHNGSGGCGGGAAADSDDDNDDDDSNTAPRGAQQMRQTTPPNANDGNRIAPPRASLPREQSQQPLLQNPPGT